MICDATTCPPSEPRKPSTPGVWQNPLSLKRQEEPICLEKGHLKGSDDILSPVASAVRAKGSGEGQREAAFSLHWWA